MAENVTFQATTLATAPDATVVAADDVAGVKYQQVKLVDATADSTTPVGTAANPLKVDASAAAVPVTDNGGSLTVDGTVAVSGTVAVTDNSGSLTVDSPVGTPVFVRLSDGSSAIATLPVSIAATVTTKEAKAATSTLSNVASSATNVTVLASNANRLGASVFNDSTQVVYLKLGATASATSYTVQLAASAYYEVPFGYTGIIDGIWASANGNARVTEVTA